MSITFWNSSEMTGDIWGVSKSRTMLWGWGAKEFQRLIVFGHTESQGRARKNMMQASSLGFICWGRERIGNCILLYKCTSLVFQHNFRINGFVGPYHIIRIMVINTDFEVICVVIQSLIVQLPSHIALG